MSETFTIDELLDVLVGAQKAEETETAPDAYTMHQLRAILKHRSHQYIATLLRPHIESGRVECVRVPYKRIDGTVTTIPAYRLAGGNHGDGGG